MMTDQDNENRFFKMLALCPELAKFWDQEERMAKMKTLQTHLLRMPAGEGQMLRFFMGVWFGNTDLSGFDFFIAAKELDEKEIRIIRKWLVEPFFCSEWA
jgi:hypothetical protein